MKYNKTEIMKKANALRKAYGMSKSESLVKAWGMAKLAKLENELFILNMKDLSGGRTNIIAQNQIRANNAAIAELEAKIANLKNEIYPRVSVTVERKFDMYDRNKILKRINDIKIFFPNLKDELVELKSKLEKGVEMYTSEKLDTEAYSAA